MEQLDYNLMFRWFVGLSMYAPIWDVTVFTKNRDRLLEGDVAAKFMVAVRLTGHQRAMVAIAGASFMARSAATIPMLQAPTLMPGYTRRPEARRPSFATWGIC